MDHQRYVTMKASTGTVRTETYLGRQWTVVPVVALVEGVIHAMNASDPELVKYETFSKFPEGWNGRPVFVGHPMKNGRPIPGNTPDTLEALSIGQVFNASIKKSKLVMEAWIDNERAAAVPDGPALLERVTAGDPIEISIGAFVDFEGPGGEYNGKEYADEWTSITPEHLALLPEGTTGACSRDMGCGVRAAKAKGDEMPEPKKGLMQRIMGMVRSLQQPEDMSDNDVRRVLSEAVRKVDSRSLYVEAIYDDYFVYCVYDYNNGETEGYYKRTFTIGANGEATLGDAAEVEPVLTYEPTVAAAPAVIPPVAASGTPCTCKDKTPITADDIVKIEVVANKEKNMKKEDVLTKLDGATPEQLEAIGKVFEPAVVATPAVVAEPAVAAAVKPVVAKTEAEILALASPEMRDALTEGFRVGKERKAVSIKTLQDSGRCDLTAEQLGAKSQGELDSLVKLAGIKVAVDFSGQGTARVADTDQAPPPAPDLTAAIRAARAAK